MGSEMCIRDSKYAMHIDPSHPILPWIVEYAGGLRSCYTVTKNGKTPMERIRGRGIKVKIAECGEKVLYKELAASDQK